MAAPTTVPVPTPSPPKRPRLSLQTKTLPNVPVLGKSVTALRIDVNPSSPTSFNTLSNAYATAIEKSSPITTRPLLKIDSKAAGETARPMQLRVQTQGVPDGKGITARTQTPGPFSIVYPDTPSSAIPSSATSEHAPDSQALSAQSLNFTPPQSALANERRTVFTFASSAAAGSPLSPRTPRRRATISSLSVPYTHPRSLHSILRNSPLPPRSSLSPVTTKKIPPPFTHHNKRVEYDNPLTQTITTNTYIKSHIDLLTEDASPYSPANSEAAGAFENLDMALADSNSTRDGGQTPGPFEEMRRRMAGLGSDAEAAEPGGIKKRKRREKLRQWRWTIGPTGEEGEEGESANPTPMTAVLPSQMVPEYTRAVAVSASEPASEQSSGPESETEMERPGSSQSV